MLDVLIVGAGPAGSVAGIVLARAGARVRLVDRADFPRAKLCGDTVNPGTLARLRSLGVGTAVEEHGLPVHGMLVTGERGAAIAGRYPNGLTGRAILRRDLDWLLLEAAVKAGCEFDPHVAVREAIVDRTRVTGARAGANGSTRHLSARVTIAADGRRSTIAFGLGLARHPDQPRRWAIGAYFEGVTAEVSDTVLGEMHVRRGRYVGVAPVPGGVTNVCLVKPSHPADGDLRDPSALLADELTRDPLLRDRFTGARLVTTPVVLGPLAVDVRSNAVEGLLLAGDAAGFIDPITGDGLRFAVRGGELAAAAALDALTHGWKGVHARLAATRRREFGAKWRFNRALRTLVASPHGVSAAAATAPFAPAVVRAIISRAGDCGAVPLG
jgi:flavin-dependent dehydrogenase